MTAPSNRSSGRTVAINMAGVVARPVSVMDVPTDATPAAKELSSAPPEIRGSHPTTRRRPAAGVPVFSESHRAKARPMK